MELRNVNGFVTYIMSLVQRLSFDSVWECIATSQNEANIILKKTTVFVFSILFQGTQGTQNSNGGSVISPRLVIPLELELDRILPLLLAASFAKLFPRYKN